MKTYFETHDNLIRTNFIALSFTFLFLLEGVITLYHSLVGLEQLRLLAVYKIAMQVIIIFLIDFKNLNKRLLIMLVALTAIFMSSLLINPILKSEIQWLFSRGSIYFFDKYIFIFLIVLMIYSRKDKTVIIDTTFKYIRIILILNLVLMIIAFIFGVDIFKSYYGSARFGYDGIFNKVNEVTHIYSIFLIHLYYTTFVSKTNHWWQFALVALSCLVLGSKTIFLVFLLLFVLHTIRIKNKWVRTIGLSCVLVFMFFFKSIVSFAFGLFPFWKDLQSKYEFLTLLLSKRDILLNNSIDYIENQWNIWNYFIGGAFYNKSFAITQMDGPDLFLFYGAIGTIGYLFIIFFVFLNKKDKISLSLILIIILSGLLSGGLFTSIMSMLLLFLVSEKVNDSLKVITP